MCPSDPEEYQPETDPAADRQPIIAKFRCLGVEQRYDGENRIDMGAVTPDHGDAPENFLFWEASPMGSIELKTGGDDHGFEPGEFYYVKITPVDPEVDTNRPVNAWKLKKELNSRGECSVTLRTYGRQVDGFRLRRGRVEIDIDTDATDAVERLGDPRDGLWKVSFSPAE